MITVNKIVKKTHNKNMKAKIYLNKTILFCLIAFFIISVITIYSTLDYISLENNILIKQIIFYIIGFFIIGVMLFIKTNFLVKYSFYIYFLNLLLLLYVLIFGSYINGSKAWIELPLFGSFQPSEFMKIGLILFLAKVLNNSVKNNVSDFKIIIKCVLIFLAPTILTFLEPDTGAVLIYFIITIVMMFISGIKKRWFIILFLIILIGFSVILYMFYYEKDLFIKILGSNFFYRLDRIFDWTNSSGMQLENSVISIASGGVLGHGFNNIPIYFPELQTDFIFSSFVSCYGLIGAILLFILFFIFDNEILNIGKKGDFTNKLIASGIVAVLLYQQIQNTAMTIGILPITGITLPFISYGGSSLISFMILIGIILNLEQSNK